MNNGSQTSVVTGMIFNIQDYAVNDGPGIRTVVFLKGCPLRCQWCANPEGQKSGSELMYSELLCKRCGRCILRCPQGAITMDTAGLKIDRSLCKTCADKLCETVCLNKALKIAGHSWTVEELYQRVKTNSLFYRNSEGGVTLSGGEPLNQTEFVREFLQHCEQIGLSVGVETSGCFSWDEVADWIDKFDFYFYDLKTLCPDIHRKVTGKSNQQIIENLRRLADIAVERITVSLAVIPGVNDQPSMVQKIAQLCRELGITKMRLLPYHAYGVDKYRDLGRQYLLGTELTCDQEQLVQFKKLVQEIGIECWIE